MVAISSLNLFSAIDMEDPLLYVRSMTVSSMVVGKCINTFLFSVINIRDL